MAKYNGDGLDSKRQISPDDWDGNEPSHPELLAWLSYNFV